MEGLKNNEFYILSLEGGFEIINFLLKVKIKTWSWSVSSPFDKKTSIFFNPSLMTPLLY